MLRLLAIIYGKVMGLRNQFYAGGVFGSVDLGARTISVGNITVGGTGKTPLVGYIAEELIERGETVCILTRGYGREHQRKRVLVSDGHRVLADAGTGGDEPVELAVKLGGKAIIIADADRAAAGDWAIRKFAPTVFILDDGFQHRRVRRHLDIVCIDTNDPFGGRQMLPAGRLREPLEHMERADIVIMISGQEALDWELLRSEIQQLTPDATIFKAERSIGGFSPLNAGAINTTPKISTASFAFCGLANPSQFHSSLVQEGVNVVGMLPFRDHHGYSQSDVDEICRAARAAGADVLLTTRKDAVKLKELTFEMPCFAVELKLLIDNAARFGNLL